MPSKRPLRRRAAKAEEIGGGEAEIAAPSSSESENYNQGESADAKPSLVNKKTKRAAVGVDMEAKPSRRNFSRRATKMEEIDNDEADVAEPSGSASMDNCEREAPNQIEDDVPAKPNSLKKNTKRSAVAEVLEAKPSQKKRRSGARKEEIDSIEEESSVKPCSSKKRVKGAVVPTDPDVQFYGIPIPSDEARKRWPKRYGANKKKAEEGKNAKKEDEEPVLLAVRHYAQALVDGCVFNLNDDAYIKGEEGKPDYIAKIVEFFESTDKKPYIKARWFFKAEDTVIKDHAHLIDSRRLFYSDSTDDNPLGCIISKLRIVQVAPNMDLATREATLLDCDFYYDMSYSLQYSTFANLPEDDRQAGSEESTISDEKAYEMKSKSEDCATQEMALLDLYSGCGAMSTGLCLGARLSGINLVTRWAVDLNSHACDSLKLNHPDTEVRNESAENFLMLLKEWEKLCQEFSVLRNIQSQEHNFEANLDNDGDDGDDGDDDSNQNEDSEIFEVEKLIGICYGDPNETRELGLYFKVHWKGYGESEDTWEPIQGLSDCREKIREFVTHGYNSKILPLPGDVHIICGGPPCQGISGFNRFRKKDAPLEDEKNQQLIVFMDIVDYLKPEFVLMENVVDILKFADGFLGRYALGRLVSMEYQARLGIMAAGCYGLPQFRMRVFLWGASRCQALPQYPLPTHDVVPRGVKPHEFMQNIVPYDKDESKNLKKELYLGDAISDLPEVKNSETKDEMSYEKTAQTEFQKHIRLSIHKLMGCSKIEKMAEQNTTLYDHRPLQLNTDDYHRVCRIPKRKGANFRDLPGVKVRPDKKVEWDESIERELLPSGKPLVPNYAMTFVRGSSTKPFKRLWWDETVATVVTRAEPHNQQILHPTQDRVLTIRENARLQGFPDCYKLCGPVKERYIQVGNAVAVPVSRALGYALGMASKGIYGEKPVFKLPRSYPNCLRQTSSTALEEAADS